MQNYIEISQDDGLLASLAMILNNDKTALSCSSGTAFPTANVQIGQLCFRTDENRLYQTKDGTNWIEIADLSSSLTQQKSNILSATVSKKEVNKFAIMREGFNRFENHAAAVTGTIAIRLPVRRNTTMLTMKIRGFNYTANKSTWDLDVGGYLYSSGWVNTSAFAKSALPWGTTVRFADDGTYTYVLLGTTTTVWAYPRIWLDEVMVSVNQSGDVADPSKYYITLLTDETGFSVESTVTVNAGTSAVAVNDGVYLSTAQTISGAKTFSAVTKVTNATDATSATTGGLAVSGGVGVAKQLHVGGAATLNSTLVVSGKSTFTGQTVHNGGISATTGAFNTTTDSTSTATGALQTKGGLGVAKSAFIGLNADVGGDLRVAGKAIVDGSVTATGAIKSADETDATSTTTGAFIVSGGLGVAKSAYIGGNANIAGALDVTGKVTAAGGFAGNLVGNVTGDLTGNAATATKLAAARAINGVAFDGSADIAIVDSTKLPLTGGTMSGSLRIEGAAGANPLQTRGIQGIANGATTAGLYLNYVDQTVKTYFNGETHYIQGGVYTGNAATATKLQTARTINGVAFDGTTNITVVDSTKLPTAGGTITGALAVDGLLTANGGFKGHYVAIDNRALTPSATPKGAFGAYFTSQGGLTGTANAVYGDLLALNSYNDTSGGLANALFFAKGSKSIFHYQAAQGATTWGAASRLAYVTDNVASATKLATARTINGVSFDGTANITVADSTKVPLAGGTMTGNLSANALGVNNTVPTGGLGLSLYGGAQAGMPGYGLAFSGTAAFGTHGSVVGDWATYFTMSGATNRGWIFKSGNSGTAGNVASISAEGVATFADVVSLSGKISSPTTAYHYIDFGKDAADRMIFGSYGGVYYFRNASDNTDVMTINNGAVSCTGAFTAGGNITAYSDKRIKKNIKKIPDALSKVEALKGVTFERKDTKEKQTGLIAQDVEAVLPEAVSRVASTDETRKFVKDDELLTVSYGSLAGLFVEAIKELNKKLEDQAKLIDKQSLLIENLLNKKVSHP